jgi:hypothetical protein
LYVIESRESDKLKPLIELTEAELIVADVVVVENVEVAVVVGLTAISICLKAIFFKLSVTWKVTKAALSAIKGVPEMTPVAELSCSPIGSSPPVTDQM